MHFETGFTCSASTKAFHCEGYFIKKKKKSEAKNKAEEYASVCKCNYFLGQRTNGQGRAER